MSHGNMLLGILTGVLAAEFSGVSEWAARGLVGWAVRLSYGRSPRAHTRFVEHTQNLDNCPGQLGKLMFALGLTGRGVLDRLCQAGRSGASGWDGAAPAHFFGAAAGLSAALRTFGGDIRAQSPSRRKEFDRLVTWLGGLLRHPSEAFDEDGAALLVAATGSVCETYIDDRNEGAALTLVEAARPLLDHLGRRHHDALGLRRAHAHALLQNGRHQQAEVLLRGLTEDESAVYGDGDPRTFRTGHLLAWALACMGRAEEAETRLRVIESRLARLPGTDTALLRHVQCKRSWTVGCQRRVRESAESYDGVAADRARELGPDHPDTLDARHSKGKMLVQVGDGPGAYEILLPLLADLRRVEGRRHPNTLETRKYLAVARALAHSHSPRARRRTRRELRRVLRTQTRGHGPDHPRIRCTQQWLAAFDGSPERR